MCLGRVGTAILAGLLLVLVAIAVWAATRSFMVVRVTGESMHPALHAADLCVVRRTADVEPGDVVLFREPGHEAAVLHRAVGVAADGLVTRGDANAVADLDHLRRAWMRGRVMAVLPVGALLERWRGTGGGATLHNQSQTARR